MADEALGLLALYVGVDKHRVVVLRRVRRSVAALRGAGYGSVNDLQFEVVSPGLAAAKQFTTVWKVPIEGGVPGSYLDFSVPTSVSFVSQWLAPFKLKLAHE